MCVTVRGRDALSCCFHDLTNQFSFSLESKRICRITCQLKSDANRPDMCESIHRADIPANCSPLPRNPRCHFEYQRYEVLFGFEFGNGVIITEISLSVNTAEAKVPNAYFQS